MQNHKTIFKQPHLVYVRCMTFNHGAYIEDALNGFAMQQTNFPFMVGIIDDASTDNTTSVINEFVKNNCIYNPETDLRKEDYGTILDVTVKNNPSCIFHIVYLNENHYCKKSKLPYFIEYENAAKYVAVCEGDDYWTDPLKLQKQVDFLESHIDYGLVHTYRKIDMAGQLYETPIINYAETKETLLLSCSITTCTVMYSTQIYNLIKKDRLRIVNENNLPMSDYPLWLLIAEESKIGYLPDATANYRMLPESASHSNSKTKMYNFDKGAMLCKSIFFHRFKERGNLTGDSIRNYYEMAFHLRKRMLLSYGWTAREQIWPLLKLILYYPMIFYRSIVRKLKKN